MKSTNDIVRIVSAGGGVTIDSSKSTDDLVRIVSAAHGKGIVIIKNAGAKSAIDLVQIASVGKQNVILDLLDP